MDTINRKRRHEVNDATTLSKKYRGVNYHLSDFPFWTNIIRPIDECNDYLKASRNSLFFNQERCEFITLQGESYLQHDYVDMAISKYMSETVMDTNTITSSVANEISSVSNGVDSSMEIETLHRIVSKYYQGFVSSSDDNNKNGSKEKENSVSRITQKIFMFIRKNYNVLKLQLEDITSLLHIINVRVLDNYMDKTLTARGKNKKKIRNQLIMCIRRADIM